MELQKNSLFYLGVQAGAIYRLRGRWLLQAFYSMKRGVVAGVGLKF